MIWAQLAAGVTPNTVHGSELCCTIAFPQFTIQGVDARRRGEPGATGAGRFPLLAARCGPSGAELVGRALLTG
jgi:hypothetical protein